MANALIAQEWLYATLVDSGSATYAIVGEDGIHAEEDVPQDVTHPYVAIRRLFTGDTQTINATIVMHRPIFIVTAVGIGSNYEGIEAIADAIQSDLHQQSGSATRGQVWYCALEPNGVHFNDYRDGDARYVELGGRYRVWTQ